MAGHPWYCMKIRLENGLPFIEATIEQNGATLALKKVLLDTGSAGCIFSADRLLEIGLAYEPSDKVHRIRGVGGAEFVFIKTIDRLSPGEIRVDDFQIEAGAMDYGFEIDGILGMDFLKRVGAIIDLANLEIVSKTP